jgi:multidrug efflux system membrane fusion protein
MNRKSTAVITVLVAVGVAAWAWANPQSSINSYLPTALQSAPAKQEKATAGKKERVVPVQIAVAATRNIPIRLDGVGTVKARSKVAIKTRVDGQLFEATVKDGQLVKKGDLLFRLDPRPFEVLVKQAEANLARDQANHEKVVTDLRRFTSLAAKGISPKQREDDTQSQVAAMAATVRASEAALELARLNLSYSTIQSPIDGRIGNILVTPGNMVRANDTGALLVITELSPVYVTFALPEQYLADIRKRMGAHELQVNVKTAGDGKPTTGTLNFINNEVDSASGTIQVQALFANDDRQLVPGQFVRASVLLDELKSAVVVPARALQINSKGHYLWVAKPDSTAELRRVGIGPSLNDITTITTGLTAGETVVTDGQLRLFPGARMAAASVDQSNKKKRKDGDKSGKGGKGRKDGSPRKGDQSIDDNSKAKP